MWWAGWSAPARFANPAVLDARDPLRLRLGAHARPRARGSLAARLLVLTVFLSFVLVTTDGGRLAYNTRETTALWLDWASRLTALGEGMPVWYRGQRGAVRRATSSSGRGRAAGLVRPRACPIFAAPALRDRVHARDSRSPRSSLPAAMAALTVVWLLHGVRRRLGGAGAARPAAPNGRRARVLSRRRSCRRALWRSPRPARR